MSREEAIELLKIPIHCEDKGDEKDLRDAMNMAISALEQEPCDTISKKVVCNYISDNYRRWFVNDDAFMQCISGIDDIVSVQPIRKGHWIRKENDIEWWYECSECEQEPLKSRFTDEDILSDFCPNCGADMRGAK